MNLLGKYQNNLSWPETLPVMPIYYSRQTHYKDLDLRAVLQRETELTLDVKMVPSWIDGVNPTGFAEVNVLPQAMMIDLERLHQPVDMPDTLEDVCDQIIEIHKNYFRKTWDAKFPHLILCSGGRDSRIVAWILKYLEKEDGMDLGDLKFLCQGFEAKCFLDGMKEIGWNPEQYEVYRLDHLLEPDYYDFWHMEDNANGFVGPQVFPTRLPGVDIPNTVLVTSSFSSGFHNVPELSLFHFGHYYYDHTLCSSIIRFKDVLINPLGYEYVKFHTHLPAKYFRKTVGGDLIRDMVLKRLGNTIPLYHGHLYNFNFTPETYTRINTDYKNSNLYKTFDSDDVRDVHIMKNNIYDWKSRYLRLYGLATVFEGIDIDGKILSCPKSAVKDYHNFYWDGNADHHKFDAEMFGWYSLTHPIPPEWQKKQKQIPDLIKDCLAKKQ